MRLYYYNLVTYIKTKNGYFDPISNTFFNGQKYRAYDGRMLSVNLSKYSVDIDCGKHNIFIDRFSIETIEKILIEFIKKYGIETCSLLKATPLEGKQFYNLYSIPDNEIISSIWKVVHENGKV